MVIRRYTPQDEAALFALLAEEGDDWYDYHGEENRPRYRQALAGSVVYLALENQVLCGFCRCREDFGFGVYVFDLLVRKDCRGKNIGGQLIAQVKSDFAGQTLYVNSDVDGYYQKLGYLKVGSIFEVMP